MKLEQAQEARKALDAYHEAEHNLIKIRDELFPLGTRVRCKLTGATATVRGGSLFADNILTERGHMGFSYLERIP